jgi:manganese/iron transport system permease protein
MIADLLVPFQYEYLVKAMLVSALIGATCGFLSCFVILKRWSLMGDALSHAIVPGVGIAYLFGAPFSIGAFLSGLLAAISMGVVRRTTALKEDAVIGVVFTAFFALGLFIISLYPAGVSLNNIIFGNILGINDADIRQVIVVSGITFLALILKWRDLALYCFDPNHARTIGMSERLLHYMLLTLLSATAVASLQTVGACLVVATLVTPGTTAYLLTDRFGVMIGISIAIGMLSGFFGAYGSYFLDGSTGGCIVALQFLFFILAFLAAPKHGLFAQRLRRRAELAEGAV